MALWATEPILIYHNCGLPYGTEKDIEDEVLQFQREGVIRLWQYEGERGFEGSLAPFKWEAPQVVTTSTYEQIVRFVDVRVEASIPDTKSLGFESTEGMLLEQVLQRRRCFSQAISGALGVNTLADATRHMALYENKVRAVSLVNDTVKQFFDIVSVPSLVLLDAESYLNLRHRSRIVLREVIAELYYTMSTATDNYQVVRNNAVSRLVRRYEAELKELVKKQHGVRSKVAIEEFENGTRTQIESKLALFYLNDPIADLSPWFSQSEDGSCKLALLLLELKTGKLGLSDFK